VTTELKVEFLRPVFSETEIRLHAQVVEQDRKRFRVGAELTVAGAVHVRAEVQVLQMNARQMERLAP